MSDKKKKIFTPKDPIVPRRPMILKSDRETSKDQAKEKHEKEKPPTIILKTREHSTPKEERPQSPKTLKTPTSENEGIHPSKIAQNEKNEKKDHKPSPPLKQMTEPIKLLDENLEFNNAALEFLNDSSTNYLVVGVIGTQGVGKSMIMNLLTQNQHTQNLCAYILHSHEMNGENAFNLNEVTSLENQMEVFDLAEASEKGFEKTNIDFKFKMQDIEQIERGVHCTKGVDMYVTPDRVILLDCQALFSPALIEESNASPVTARSANVVTEDCLQVASYLMAVCHVLIAVQDWFTDYNFLRYLQAAEMLKPSLWASAPQDGEPAPGDAQPHLLLLHNRCQLEDFTPEAVKTMQDLYRKSFQKSNLQLHSGMYLYSDANRNGPGAAGAADAADAASAAGAAGGGEALGVGGCGAPLNLFLLPEIYHDYDNREVYRGHPPFWQLARRLRWLVLGARRHALSNVPQLTERGWLQYCAKAWETIRKCTFFMEYERFLP